VIEIIPDLSLRSDRGIHHIGPVKFVASQMCATHVAGYRVTLRSSLTRHSNLSHHPITPESPPTRKLCHRLAVPLLKVAVAWLCSLGSSNERLRMSKERGLLGELLSFRGARPAPALEQGMVERQSSCADGGECEAPSQHREGEFVIVHCQIASCAVDLPDGHAHFDGE